MAAPSDMIPKLEQVRQACLADASQYVSVVPGVVPILQGAQEIDVRRWGAGFMAEAFASPELRDHQKEQMLSEPVLALLRSMLDNPAEDSVVVKSTVQVAASIYPHVFRKIISHPELVLIWRDMSSIKISVLQRMDTAPLPVRICCIKFLQKVVQVQTPGQISDPRKPEQNETSIALVGRNHPLLPLANIEAETLGILDRLLSVIQENSTDPLVVDPTMNCLAVLLRTRPAIQAKIIQTLLNYNPLRAAGEALTPRTIVAIKSLQRTTRALLRWVMRIMQGNPILERVDQYLRRLQAQASAFFAHAQSMKRPAEGDLDQDNASAKRQKTEAPRNFFPMPPPPNTVAQLFTLVDNPEFQQFDVKILPQDVVILMSNALMQHIDSKSLDEAVEEVQGRIRKLEETARTMPTEDDDDYDPEATTGAQDHAQGNEELLLPPTLDLGPFELPKPDPLTNTELAMLSEQTIAQVFDMALHSSQESTTKQQKLGVNRIAADSNDKDSWLTVLVRIATRAPAGLDALTGLEEDEQKEEPDTKLVHRGMDVPNRIRRLLFDYVIADWKHRLSLAISWLTEEWYADKVQVVGQANGAAPTTKPQVSTKHYEEWTVRLFETLVPRFDKDDHRHLIRFLSELPSLNARILALAKPLARDPATIDICKKAMQYLYMLRPPVRDMVVDITQDMWIEGDEDIKAAVAPLLKKWRPGFENEAKPETIEETRTYPNGVKAEALPNGKLVVSAES